MKNLIKTSANKKVAESKAKSIASKNVDSSSVTNCQILNVDENITKAQTTPTLPECQNIKRS